VAVEEAAGTPIEQVCIGSSVNSAYLDLALPGAVLAAGEGREVHERVTATATPGSRQILVAIAESGVYRQLVEGGVRMLEPVCGPCVGMGQAPPSDANSLRTFNRNFPGRSGTPEDEVYLCSPAVAAVSMLHGEIRDPREHGEAPELLEMPELKPYTDDRHIFPPAPEGKAASIEIPRGPNIKTPPEHTPLEDELSAKIATVQPDNISTGDLAPDGVIVMSYRSNIPAIAEFTFQHRDPEFRKRMHEWGSGLLPRARRARAVAAGRTRGVRQVVCPHPPPQPRRPGHPGSHLQGRVRLRARQGGRHLDARPCQAGARGRGRGDHGQDRGLGGRVLGHPRPRAQGT
jgi:aconitate hydratase